MRSLDACAIINGMSTARQSAGLLVYRQRAGTIEVFLVHPGGPFWRGKDAGAWSIPKGEFAPGEDPLSAAQREFQEETGQKVSGQFTPLAPIRQRGGKTVYAWQIEADVDATNILSNKFSMEWPPQSGQFQDFPEIDQAGWFTIDTAAEKIITGQRALLDELKSSCQTKPASKDVHHGV
jgi:predicted NUDIX family NTP pyrophosphohydrolase